jgi:hypothetical protein
MSPRKTKDNPLGLDPVDGQSVTEIGIEIPGAAGGFREPLDVDMTLIDGLKDVHQGDTIFCVLQLTKAKWRYQPAKNHDGLKRVDIFAVGGAAIVGAEFAEEAIHEQRERTREAAENAAGQGSMVDGKSAAKPDADHRTEPEGDAA